MSKDAFAAHVGRPAYVDPEAVALGTGLVCGYNGGQIILFSGEGAPGRTGRG